MKVYDVTNQTLIEDLTEKNLLQMALKKVYTEDFFDNNGDLCLETEAEAEDYRELRNSFNKTEANLKVCYLDYRKICVLEEHNASLFGESDEYITAIIRELKDKIGTAILSAWEEFNA